VAFRLQSAANVFADRFLHREPVRLGKADTGRRDRLLHVHGEIHEIHHHLWNRLTDRMPARSTQCDPRPAVPHQDRRAVSGELAPPGMRIHRIPLGLERAELERVVQPDAGPARHDATAEKATQRLRR
jgi:hypothetical protein